MLLFKGAIKMGKCHDNYVQKFLTKHRTVMVYKYELGDSGCQVMVPA